MLVSILAARGVEKIANRGKRGEKRGCQRCTRGNANTILHTDEQKSSKKLQKIYMFSVPESLMV